MSPIKSAFYVLIYFFSQRNQLYLCLINTCYDLFLQSEEPVLPVFINTSTTGARLDPKICPKNSDLVAFVHSNDVWVTNLVTQQECRLTFAHKGKNIVTDIYQNQIFFIGFYNICNCLLRLVTKIENH